MQIPTDALITPLAATTAAFLILAYCIAMKRPCTNYSAAAVSSYQFQSQDYAVVLNSTEIEPTSSVQVRLLSYLGSFEWDAMTGGLLPFCLGWLILSTVYIYVTTQNGCR